MEQNPAALALQQTQQTQQPQSQLDIQNAQMKQNEVSVANQQAAISQALATLKPNSSDPAVKVGKAILSPAYAGYCQQFADDTTGTRQRYPSAIETWAAKVADGSAKTNFNQIKPGDVIEFNADDTNGNLGHAAVVTSTKNGIQLKMATYSGVESYNLNDWQKFSGQTPLGFYSPSK